MKLWPLTIVIVIVCVLPARAFAASIVKLPYAKGQRFVVTQGYDTPPTHIKKDAFALDLTQNGCDAYGKAVVAAASGTVMFASEEGYNGGYGTELIIDHGSHVVSRYAHMIPGTITVAATGTAVRRGEMLGSVGDTGLVAGAACAAHPGTHLHFAMDTINPDGTFSALDPEPISGYAGMAEGQWYLSDNEDDSDDFASSLSAPAPLGSLPTTNDFMVPTTSEAPTTTIVFGGGTSITTADAILAPPPLLAASTSDMSNVGSAVTSTLDASTSITTEPPPIATGTLFSQLDDGASSLASWYDDNWFDLGDGFTGTLTMLTLEGHISGRDYAASRITLQEFKDASYTAMVAEFPVSDNAPFTTIMATTTFTGLSIPLKPYFYYRISTMQDIQNLSVILGGTASTTSGMAMWNRFIYGAGRVEYTEPFFPFVVMEGIIATSTIVSSPITPPGDLSERFDSVNMQLVLAWSTSTDPDWPANPLHYEVNYSTSTALSDDGWSNAYLPASIPLTVGNSYLIGVRAKDNFGDVSAVTTAAWSFPAGFAPYLLSPLRGYAYQYFTVPSTSTLRSIQLFTANLYTNARNTPGCTLQLFDEYASSSYGMVQSDNMVSGYDCAGTPTFSFASSSFMMHPDHRYHWVYTIDTWSPYTGASVQFYGTATDTAGGMFSDSSLVNAKFTVTGDTGVLFSN